MPPGTADVTAGQIGPGLEVSRTFVGVTNINFNFAKNVITISHAGGDTEIEFVAAGTVTFSGSDVTINYS